MKSSYFHITTATNLPPMTLYFQSSSARLYSMLGCADLLAPAWTNVPGPPPRPGLDGPDTLSDTNDPPRGPHYRLKVQLP